MYIFQAWKLFKVHDDYGDIIQYLGILLLLSGHLKMIKLNIVSLNINYYTFWVLTNLRLDLDWP